MRSLHPRVAVFKTEAYKPHYATRKRGGPGAALAYSATETDT
jgi:hypothetical protein